MLTTNKDNYQPTIDLFRPQESRIEPKFQNPKSKIASQSLLVAFCQYL